MIEIEILAIGKTKEAHLQKAIDDYEKRLLGKIKFTWRYYKKEEDLLLRAKMCPMLVALDVKGTAFSTELLSDWLKKSVEKSKGWVTFVIGGPDGLPPELKAKARISLSQLTLTHQMVRLLFVEQIYRCYTIWTDHPYHK